MTNDKDITRYEINEHGELPLSYGRYVRYEDYEDVVRQLLGEIEHFRDKAEKMSGDYSDGFDDGYDTGYSAAREELDDDSSVFHVNLGDEDCKPYSVDED